MWFYLSIPKFYIICILALELVDNSNVFYIFCYGVVHHNRTERQRSRTATNDTIFRIVEKHSVDSIPVVVEVEKPVRYRSGYDRFTSRNSMKAVGSRLG